MKLFNILIICALVLVLASPVAMAKGRPPKTEASNNLSYPVIWAEGVQKTLNGTEGVVLMGGDWWYSWGTAGADPNIVPLSCAPDPDNDELCDDGIPGGYDPTLVPGTLPATGPYTAMPLVRAYLQKHPENVWRATSASWGPYNKDVPNRVTVHKIDWGDNLESNNWYLTSQVRTEVVLFEDIVDAAGLPTDARVGEVPWLEYEMRHVSGWGIDEVHGMAVTTDNLAPVHGPGISATIYSPCARFTIQKLLVSRDDTAALASLMWVPGAGWTEEDGVTTNLINDVPLFNKAVHEASDGPGYYSAEINVKGRIIYGYTWNVRKANEGAGDYRLTFSFDDACGAAVRNTQFLEGTTQILVPAEEVAAEAVEDDGGTAQLDFGNNLTYIDVRILARSGGGPRRAQEQEQVQEQEHARYCQDGTGECCEDGSVCLAVRERTAELVQLQAQIECEGELCTQFQARLRELVQVLERLQLRTCLADGDCTCTCQDGDECLQIKDQIRVLEQLRDQLCELCTDGECPCDTELFDVLGAALLDLNLSLASPAQGFFMYLPALADAEQ